MEQSSAFTRRDAVKRGARRKRRIDGKLIKVAGTRNGTRQKNGLRVWVAGNAILGATTGGFPWKMEFLKAGRGLEN